MPLPASDREATRTVSLQIRIPTREGAISLISLALAVLFNLTQLYPEIAIRTPALNDDVLHLLTLGQTVSAMLTGRDPTDFWLGPLDLGYPLFHYYQHLPIVLPAALYVLFFHLFHQVPPLDVVLSWITYLLLSVFPLSIYWSMHRFGFARVTAALAGLVASLLSTNGLYGFDFSSYVWIGHGLYTQLWAMVLLPPTLALGYRALRDGRGYVWAVLGLAATIMSNLVIGYIAAGSLVLFALLRVSRREQGRSAGRLALLLALSALTIAYFVVPFLRDSAYMNRSVWELPEKYDSYGYQWVLESLVHGDLFDFGRFPSLTILAGVGVAVCLRRWRDERYRIPLALAVLWLLLYFGRPTWGSALDLLPLSRDLQLHRLIAGVHLAGIYLIGIGLAAPWGWALARRNSAYLVAPAVLTALLLYPVYSERVAYLAANARIMEANQQAYVAEQQDLDALLATLRSLPPGRVYAGLPRTWGQQYRVGDVPVYAVLQGAGLDTLGYLYHALSLNADVEILFDETRPEDYNLFNVRYVVAPIGQPLPPFLKPIKDFGRNRLYQVATTGYFDLVGSNVTLAGDPRDFYPAASSWLASDQPRVKENPIVRFDGVGVDYNQVFPLARAGALVPPGMLPNEPGRGQVIAETAGSDSFQAQVAVDRPSTLMLKVTYHPGWHAYVDGVEVATAMVLPSYVGVSVAPGTHQVRLVYRPGPLRGYLMLLGLLTLLATGVVEWRRARKLPAMFRASDDVDEPARSIAPGRPRVAAVVRPTALPSLASPVGSRTKLGIFLLFLSVYLATSAGHFISNDHVAVYLTTQSLVERHDLAIQPILDTIQGKDGRFYARYQLGQSLLSIPLYVVGTVVDHVGSPEVRRYFTGPNYSLGYWGSVPIYFVDLFNQFVTALTCVVVFLFGLRLGFSIRGSFVTTLVFGLATGTLVYAREYFQHPLETLALLTSVYILFSRRERLTPRHALFAGLAFALGVLTRLNVALIGLPLLLYLLSKVPTGGDRLKRYGAYALAFTAPVAVVLVSILYVNLVRFGSYTEFGNLNDRGFSTPLWLGVYGYLFSVGRSIFFYSPPVVLGAFALPKLYRRHRAEAILVGCIVGIYLGVYSTFVDWHGGWSWGPRYLSPLLPFLVLPIGYFWRSRRGRIAIALGGTLGVLVQILGVTVNYSDVYAAWMNQQFNPADAYLYDPIISATPTHLQALSEGRFIDLRLLWVLQQFGPGIFLATTLVAIVPMGVALAILRPALGATGPTTAVKAGSDERSFEPSEPSPTVGRLMARPAVSPTPLRVLVGIYLLFLSVYLVSGSGHFFSTDHIAVYLTAQSLVEQHTLAIKRINDAVLGRDGEYYSSFGIGQSLTVIPLYLAGKAVDTASSPAVRAYFSGTNLGDWGGTVPIFFVSLFNQLVTPLTGILVFLFCRRFRFSKASALAVTLIFGFCTATWVYARDSFQHPLETLLLLSCFYLLSSRRSNLTQRQIVLAGAILAFGVFTRLNLLFVAPAVAIYVWLAVPGKDRWGRGARNVVLFSAPIVLVVVVLLFLNDIRFGNALIFHAPGQAKGLSTPLWLGLYGNLFSVGRSIFLYSPPTIVGLLAYSRFYRAYRAEALLFLSTMLIYLGFYSVYGFWDGGWSWGPRFFLAIVPLLIIGVGFFPSGAGQTALLALTAVAGIGVQILGVTVNYSYVTWDWINLKLSPPDAYLYVPEISPIPTHLMNLVNGRNVDLWLLWVYHQFGLELFVLTLVGPVALLAVSLFLLRPLWKDLWRSLSMGDRGVDRSASAVGAEQLTVEIS